MLVVGKGDIAHKGLGALLSSLSPCTVTDGEVLVEEILVTLACLCLIYAQVLLSGATGPPRWPHAEGAHPGTTQPQPALPVEVGLFRALFPLYFFVCH